VTITIDLAPPRRVLAIGAHPDDVEFGCGATLAKWCASGAHVELLVLTDGSKGTWDAATATADLVAARRAEQRDAAAVLGIASVHLLGCVDGELVAGLATRGEVCRVIRSARPDVVLGHDPWKRYRLHPDHREAGRLCVEGIVAARDPHFFAGMGAPHRPAHLLLFEADAVDHVEDVGGFVAAKVDALLRHRSQWRSTMGIDVTAADGGEAEREAFRRRITDEAEQAARDIGTDVEVGEAFKRVDDL
jgi:LmbE family N-acetylglucosaminyl deacetylase